MLKSNIQSFPALPKHQKGIALIVTLVVLLALTILGVAATDSGNLQSVMTRNNQFRLETFNVAHAEIDAQLDAYRSVASGTITDEISFLLEADAGTKITDTAPLVSGSPLITEKSVKDSFDKTIGLTKSGGCVITGETIGLGKQGTNSCNLFTLETDARYTDTNVQSQQVQTFSVQSRN